MGAEKIIERKDFGFFYLDMKICLNLCSHCKIVGHGFDEYMRIDKDEVNIYDVEVKIKRKSMR